MNALLQTLRTRWAVIALAVAAIAFVAGVSYGLRTSDGIGAQAPSETPVIPPSLKYTPTTEETRDIIGTAEAIIANTGGGLIIEVIDPKTGKPAEESAVAAVSKEEAAYNAAHDKYQAAYDVAHAKYSESRWTHYFVVPHRLTTNFQEYLDTDPDRAIYLVEIDRVIHLPKGIRINWIQTEHGGNPTPPRTCPTPTPQGCPASLPAYQLVDSAEEGLYTSDGSLNSRYGVLVDSSGHVFLYEADTLPDNFSFLSGLKVVR